MLENQQEILNAKDEAIHLVYQDKTIIPFDDESAITIDYFIENKAEDEEVDDTNYLINVRRIYGTVNLGNPDSALSYLAKVDTEIVGWTIKCTNRLVRINGMIFPHEIDINLDDMTMLVKFDVLG